VGKSTLLHLVGGLDAADGGTIRIGDAEITAMTDADRVAFRNRHVGFVFQFHHLLPEFNALENVEMPLRIGREPAALRLPRAQEVLGRVGLAERLEHRPGMLSGGEQQRVAVARALVMRPDLLLADALHIYYLAANLAAWFLSVLFAYVTNRLRVFTSTARGFVGISKEALLFFGCRAFSGLADMLIMYCLVDVLIVSGTLSKIITGAAVVSPPACSSTPLPSTR
jgi:ABC-type uncharacterized transport system YnjBCD ATPase subunit